MVPQHTQDGTTSINNNNTNNNSTSSTMSRDNSFDSLTSTTTSHIVNVLQQNGPLFGSQLVDKNSSTPYTDATQVSHHNTFIY